MSFFDEADEPAPRPRRTEPRRPRPAGRGGPPRDDQQAIHRRQAGAVAVIVVVIVLIALLIHSCSASARTSALKDYTSSVYTIMQSSNSLGTELFSDLSDANSSCSGVTELNNCVQSLAGQSGTLLRKLQGLSVPGGMEAAQRELVLTLKMRHTGFVLISNNVVQAFTTSSAAQAVQQMTLGTSQLFASDVVYKSYAASDLAKALNANGINAANEPIYSGQIISDLNWLQATFVIQTLGVQVPNVASVVAPTINQVAVGSNTMVSGVTNHVAAIPEPTFTITITNPSKSATDYTITCAISVGTLGDSGSVTIPELAPGQSTTCAPSLSSSPPQHLYDVTAKVAVGLNPKNSATYEFPVQFEPEGYKLPGGG